MSEQRPTEFLIVETLDKKVVSADASGVDRPYVIINHTYEHDSPRMRIRAKRETYELPTEATFRPIFVSGAVRHAGIDLLLDAYPAEFGLASDGRQRCGYGARQYHQ